MHGVLDLDDAAFSVGGLLARAALSGARVTVLTCFTASVAEPTGFALACQLDKGLPADADYLALRRAEDDRAMARLGVAEVLRLPLPEAPHRGYPDAAALFAGVRRGDDVDRDLAAALRPLLPRFDLVLAPQGCGHHVDHLQVVAAVRSVLADGAVGWWRDTPYVLRDPKATGVISAPEQGFDAAPGLAAKLAAGTAYRSQLGFQFGGEQVMRVAPSAFADAEGRRMATGGPAEVLRGDASVLEQLVHPGHLGGELAGVAGPDVCLEHQRHPR